MGNIEQGERTLDFDSPVLRRGFTSVPNALLENSSVSVGARMTLIALMSFAWKRDPFPGQERLGQMLGVTDRTIRDYITELREAGLLTVQRRGKGNTNLYRIVSRSILAPEKSSARPNDYRNSASALDRNSASGEVDEVEEDEVTTAPAAKNGRPRNEIWDALAEVFGEPTTPSATRVRGKVAAELAVAGATPSGIIQRARTWPQHFENATLTDLAFAKHYDTLGRKPLRRQR